MTYMTPFERHQHDEAKRNQSKGLIKSTPTHASYKPFTALAKSALTMSPTANWFFAEDAKRKNGLPNEIDFNEIKAAVKGVKNTWFEAVKNNKKEFESIIGDHKNYDWEKLKTLKTSKVLTGELILKG